jgi:hypothetical protein
MVVPHRAVQREAVDRPLVLQVQRPEPHPLVGGRHAGVHPEADRNRAAPGQVLRVARVVPPLRDAERHVAARPGIARCDAQGAVAGPRHGVPAGASIVGRVVVVVQAQVVDLVPDLLHEVGAFEPDLHVVRPGDVGHARPAAVRVVVDEGIRRGAGELVVERARALHVEHAAIPGRAAERGVEVPPLVLRMPRREGVGADGCPALTDAWQVARVGELARLGLVLVRQHRAQARFEENPVGVRIGPRQLHEPVRTAHQREIRLRRVDDADHPVAGIRARVLLVPVDVELVLLGRLQREPHARVLVLVGVRHPPLVVARPGGVAFTKRHVVGREHTLVQVGVRRLLAAARIRLPVLHAPLHVEPEAVPHHRTAEGAGQVEVVDERVVRQGRGIALRWIPAQPAAAVPVEEARLGVRARVAAGIAVAPRARHDVDRRPAGLGLAERTRQREGHFLCPGRVEHDAVGQADVLVDAGAGAAHVDGHAVHHDASLVLRLHGAVVDDGRMRVEERHGRVAEDANAAVAGAAQAARHHAGHQIQDARDVALRREVGNLGTGNHVLLMRIDDVHHRGFGRDRHLVGDTPDAHVGVHGDCRVGGHDNALTSDRAEAGQCERHFVRTDRQRLDLIAAAAVGGCRTDFLDERRAGDLHGHAGQYCL